MEYEAKLFILENKFNEMKKSMSSKVKKSVSMSSKSRS